MRLSQNFKGYRVILFVLMLGMFFTLPVLAESAPSVLMIDVQGNDHVPAEKVLGVISKTKIGEALNSQSVQEDMQSIMNLGYFANVEVKTEKFFDGIKLIFMTVENPIFKEVKINGLTKIKDEEIKPFFSQKQGEIFNMTAFKEDLSKALKYCKETKGLFIEPKAKGSFGIAADGTVNLELVEIRIGRIKIQGLVKTKENVVRREISFKEGDILDYNLLREDYLKLMRLRLFDNIDIQFENNSTPGYIDLVMDFKEASTGTGTLGISYNESSHQLGGIVGYSEANLMGTGQSLSLDINISEDSKDIKFSFYEPWLDDKHTSFGVSMWNADSSITSTMASWSPTLTGDYDIDLTKMGMSLSLGRQFWKNTTARMKFKFEKNEIDNFWDANSDYDEDTTPSLTIPYPQLHPAEFWDNSLEIELDKNKLLYQDRNFVNGGYELTGSYRVGGKYLGGEFDYNQMTLEGKWFHALSSNLVFGTRLQGSYLTGDYPDYNSLYLGGMYGLRGYDDRRLHDELTRDLIGESSLLSNSEFRYRLSSNKDLEFVLFYDIGEVNNGGTVNVKSDYGVGFRYNVPLLGVIRVDQAWNSDGEARLAFSIGEMF